MAAFMRLFAFHRRGGKTVCVAAARAWQQSRLRRLPIEVRA